MKGREGGRGAEVYCEGEVWGQFFCVKEREVWAYSFAVSRGGRYGGSFSV